MFKNNTQLHTHLKQRHALPVKGCVLCTRMSQDGLTAKMGLGLRFTISLRLLTRSKI